MMRRPGNFRVNGNAVRSRSVRSCAADPHGRLDRYGFSSDSHAEVIGIKANHGLPLTVEHTYIDEHALDIDPLYVARLLWLLTVCEHNGQ